VLDNRVEFGAGFPLNGVLATRAANCRIAGNRFDETVHGIVLSGGSRNCILDNRMQSGGTGVWLTGETAPMLSGNRLDDLPGAGITGYLLYGTVTMTGNRVLNCSYEGRAAMGIGVALHLGELQIESCEVMNTGVSPDGETIVQPAFGIVGLYVLESRIQGNLVSYSNLDRRNVDAEDRALYLMGLMEYQLSDRIVLGWAAQVVDNKFSGTGATALIEFLEQPIGNLVVRFERVVFNNNYCFHWTRPQQDDGVTVLLRGRSAIVMGNHIKSLGSGLSVLFGGVRGIFLGNDTQGGSDINFPANENQFNH